jgi:3-(3-hydroxy-phenyl)propionate hydroxylase
MSNLTPASLETLRRIGAQRVVVSDLPAPAHNGVKAYVETQQLFTAWLQDNGMAAAIVRPDRYVFGGAQTAEELNALVLKLGQLLSGQVFV